MFVPQDDYLAHYGVKGMKWGVRKDGDSSRRAKVAGVAGAALVGGVLAVKGKRKLARRIRKVSSAKAASNFSKARAQAASYAREGASAKARAKKAASARKDFTSKVNDFSKDMNKTYASMASKDKKIFDDLNDIDDMFEEMMKGASSASKRRKRV